MSKSTPLVSIVIPAYNAEKYILSTLISASQQTYNNIEIIIVNDGSVDNTELISRIFCNYDGRAFQIITENKGVASARNTGIECSNGEYIAFLDADDLWHPTKIERQMEALSARSSDWAAAYSYHRIINQNDLVMGSSSKGGARGSIFCRHINHKYVGNGSTLLVRRDAAISVGGFEPDYAARGIGGCEDLDFELKIAARYLVDFVPEWLVGYRTYPGNMSSNLLRMGQGMIAVIQQHLSANPDTPLAIRSAALAKAHAYGFVGFVRSRRFDLIFPSLQAMGFAPSILVRALFDMFASVIVPRLKAMWTALGPGRRPSRVQPPFYELQPREGPAPVSGGGFEARLLELCETADRVRQDQRL